MTLDSIIDAIGVKPYHREPAGVIYCADCLDILPRIPDRAIDLCLTDPPYGVRKTEDWDAEDLFCKNINRWVNQLRLISDRLIWFCAGKMIPYIVQSRPSEDFFRLLVWNKPAGSQYNGASHNNLWYSSEPILLFGEKEKWNEKGKDSKMSYSVFNARTIAQNQMGHMTTKPLALIKWLMGHHSNENDIILDPFLGSGTTAVAAKQLGRRYIGIEIEERYCEIAVKRLSQEVLSFGQDDGDTLHKRQLNSQSDLLLVPKNKGEGP